MNGRGAVKRFGVFVLLALWGCSPAVQREPQVQAVSLTAPPDGMHVTQTSAASSAAPSAAPVEAPAPPPIALDNDACLLADAKLDELPAACRCLAQPSLSKDPAWRREACEVARADAAWDQLRVTGSVSSPDPWAAGGAFSISLVVENTGTSAAVIHRIALDGVRVPRLLNASDAQGRRVDVPVARCEGVGAEADSVLSDGIEFDAVVLPPGGRVHSSTSWWPREVMYLRDVPNDKKNSQANDALAIMRAFSPCELTAEGPPLPAGHYTLSYSLGLRAPSGRGLVPVSVKVP